MTNLNVCANTQATCDWHGGPRSIPTAEMKNIIAIAESLPTMKILCQVPFKDKMITELDLSGKNLGVEGAMVVSHYIHDNGALVSANLLNNDISAEQAQSLAGILKEHATLKSLCGNKGNETELDMSGKKMGADGAILFAPEIVANGALAKLTFGGDEYTTGSGWNEKTITPEPTVLEVGMTEANLSNKNLCAGGAIIVGAWISHKDNGALSLLDLSHNRLGDTGLVAFCDKIAAHQR